MDLEALLDEAVASAELWIAKDGEIYQKERRELVAD